MALAPYPKISGKIKRHHSVDKQANVITYNVTCLASPYGIFATPRSIAGHDIPKSLKMSLIKMLPPWHPDLKGGVPQCQHVTSKHVTRSHMTSVISFKIDKF